MDIFVPVLRRFTGNVGYLEMREIASIGIMAGAAGAIARAARTAENRRIDPLIGSATVAVGCPRGSKIS
jgi:hypothetical protein